MRRILPLFATLAAPLAAQTLTFAEGTASSLTIATVPESNPNAPDTVVLQAVEFLPIEITGRTRAQELDATQSRRVTVAGITRVELPGGARLFRYRRSGGAFWGFLHIADSGAPTVVLERPGVGAQLLDPFDDRIAVAPDGLHAAISLQAGGLWVVRLDGGVYASTGTVARQVAGASTSVVPMSLLVGSSFVWYQRGLSQNTTQVLRCDLADGAVPVDVSPPAQANAFTKDQMAMSRDGSVLVFLYGPQNLQQLWTCGATGTSTVLPPLPSKYEEPNYLPEGPGEPAMLVSDDGTRLFFIDAQVRDELGLLDLTGVLPTLQITESTIFQPYIGTHILPKFAADRLFVAIGDPQLMDWFRVELAPTGGVVTNLTGTGSLAQPFPSGTLDPVQAAGVAGAVLVAEQTAIGTALRRIDTTTGAQTVVQSDVVGEPQIGSSSGAAPDVLVHSLAGESLYLGANGALVGTLPPGLTLTPPVSGPSFSATWVALTNGFGIAALYAPGGLFATGPLEFDLQQICLTRQNGVVLVNSSLRYFAPGVSVVLNRPSVPLRLCLSGAGG